MASQSHFRRPRKVSVLQKYEKAVLPAFRWDCESFLEQFEKKNSFNYADFANLWQINNFTYIFADQTYVSPLHILCKVCFLTIKKYLMFQKSLHIKVGAFFLLYGLYYKQPIEGMVRIRLTLGEYRHIKQLMDEMVNKGQYDVLYIFAKMKSDNVFIYTAEPNPINIELNKSVKSILHIDDTFQTRFTESSITKFQNILEDTTVQALQKTCTEYDVLLKKYSGKNPGILQFKSTIVNDLKQTHQRVFGQGSLQSEADTKSEDTPIRNTRESIRLRAMQNQNAVYRGSKNIVTALDLDQANNDDDSNDEELVEKRPKKTNPKRKPRGRSRKKTLSLSKISIGVGEVDEESD